MKKYSQLTEGQRYQIEVAKRMTIKRMRKAVDWDDSVLTDILAHVF